ncbi:GNAT family N-acetyltransferase [Azospirillum thermophilum]|nr:GNAT family N-acetyltransferase [Azospirillum thermophilum]
MLPRLETDRLLLRARTPEDYDACLAMDSVPGMLRYVGAPVSPEEHARFLTDRFAARFPPGLGYWTILPKQEPAGFLGWVCLLPAEDGGPVRSAEIGWRIPKPAWGRGYAPEAAAAVLRHARETLSLARVIATIHPDNDQSFRVAEKIGLRFAGGGEYCGEPCVLYESAAPPPG